MTEELPVEKTVEQLKKEVADLKLVVLELTQVVKVLTAENDSARIFFDRIEELTERIK